MDELLTIREVAVLLKISVSSMYRYVETGRFPHMKIGTNIRFTRDHIKEFLNTRNLKPEDIMKVHSPSPVELQAIYDQF